MIGDEQGTEKFQQQWHKHDIGQHVCQEKGDYIIEKLAAGNDEKVQIHDERKKGHDTQALHSQNEYILQPVCRHIQQTEKKIRNSVKGNGVFE